MKLISKILYAILALIVLICALIVLCAVNPAVARTVSDVTRKIIPQKEALVDDSEDSSTIDVAAFVSTQESEEGTEEGDLSYDDYSEKRDLSDVVNDDVVEDYSNTDDDDPYKKLIDAGEEDSLFDDDYFDQFDDKSDYVVTEPVIYDITDESEAQEIIDNTGFGELGENEEFDSLYYPYYQMLKEDGKSLYKQIYANCNALIYEFKPVNECTPNQWMAAFDCVFYDHPELFWMSNRKYYEYDYSGKVIKVQLEFYKEIPDVEKAKISFNTAAQNILAGAANYTTDYEKEKYIHDVLVDKITYQFNSLDQSSFSSIPNDYTVCCGYAKAFQYLMQQLGVPTYFCVGWGGEMHAWNIIKLDDDYYNVDCTWDDTDPATYDFFNVTDRNNLMHSRMYQSRYLPPCNGTKYGGLEKEEINLSDYSVSSDKIYTDYNDYAADFLDIVANNYLTGEKDTDVKLVISQDLFMTWYMLNFDNMKSSGESDSQHYDEEEFSFTLGYERLSNGDYLITHIVHFKE